MEPNNNGAPAPAPNTNPPAPTPPAPTPPAPTPPANPPAPDDANKVQLTDEQLAAAFEHPRFKELTTAANELKTLKAAQEKAENERLQKEGQYQTLAEKAQKEAEDAKAALKTERLNYAIAVEANKLGAHDASAVAKLVDSGKVTVNDDGTITGVEDAIKALQTSSPYLFKTGPSTSFGGGDTNPQGGGNAAFTLSQFKDGAFYKANQKAMDAAMAANQVDLTR